MIQIDEQQKETAVVLCYNVIGEAYMYEEKLDKPLGELKTGMEVYVDTLTWHDMRKFISNSLR